jgi:hypothetical protein
MRRVLAITLLIAFASPLVAPLFAATADSEASLPACCRRHGAHHCGGAMAGITATSPALSAPPCPCYPAASTPLRLAAASLTAAPALARTPRLSTALYPANQRRARTFSPSANLNRGPPLLLT